ncbi:MAG: hypothetical protein GWO79_00215 [Actinobacteria bacterium]|nr:hypothetical protein [Actinomycetota bacterium]
MYIIAGIIIMAIGVTIVLKSEWMLNNFGSIAFFEEHLGSSGGSRLGYKLVGMLFFFIGLMVMTNMIGGLMQWLLSPLIRNSQPQ